MSEMPVMGDLPAMEALDEAAGLGEVVSRVNANTTAIYAGLEVLRRIAVSYAAALPASVADRKGLHEAIDALGVRITAAASAASSAGSAAAGAQSTASAAATSAAGAKSAADAAAGVATAAQNLANALLSKQARAASATVPAMTNVLTTASTDITLTWPTPWPDATYTVVPTVEVPASLLGKVAAAVKSKTAASTVITVTTSAVLASGTVTVRAASFA